METKRIVALSMCFMFFTQPVVFAVEVAPRITDREIIERLTRLEEGQTALMREMNQRFESMDKRFDMVANLMYVIIAGIFGLIGFVVWDRHNAIQPVRKDIDKLFQVMKKLAEKDQKIAEVLRSVGLL